MNDADATQPPHATQPIPNAIAPGLWVVSTPIGNLADLTPRAASILTHCDRIACEDTRRTGRLLQAIGSKTSMTPYHDHNGAAARPKLLEALVAGQAIALVSDAGTPLISDPGYKLVAAAHEAGVRVHVAPGPSAPLAALAVSGLPTDRFVFLGFLGRRSSDREASLASFAQVPATLVFFETATRLVETLALAAQSLGPQRPAAVARELTKRFEEIVRRPLAELVQWAADARPKGEIVIVVGPPLDDGPWTQDQVDDAVRSAEAGAPLKAVAKAIALRSGWSARDVYARANALKEDDHGGV